MNRPLPKNHLDASPRYLSTLVLMTIACTDSRATQTRDSGQVLDVFRGENRFTDRFFPAEMRVAIGQQLDATMPQFHWKRLIRSLPHLRYTARPDCGFKTRAEAISPFPALRAACGDTRCSPCGLRSPID